MRANMVMESEVRASLNKLNQGFASRNVEMVLGLFAPDPDVVFIASEADEVASGPTQLKALVEELLSRPEVYSWDWQHILVSAAGSVAWIVAPSSLINVRSSDGQRESFPYRLTGILERRGEDWMWVHFHGSEPSDEN